MPDSIRLFFRCARPLALAAAVTLGLTANPASARAGQLVDRIVAVVNDDVILLSELNDASRPYLAKLAEMGYSEEKTREMRFKLREDLLSQLIDRKLTDQEVRRLGISVSDGEIDAAIERVKQANFITDEKLRASIAAQGYSMQEYRQTVREQILRSKLVNRRIKSRTVITPEDVRGYYDSHPEQYGGQKRYHLRSILVPHDAADRQARQRQVDAALDAGTPFAEVARQFNPPALAASGGELGTFPLDRLAESLQQAVRSLEAGAHTDWIDTDQGYQIFQVEQIVVSEGKTLDQVADQIEEELYKQFVDEKFRTWLAELRDRSYIRVVR